MPPRCPKGTHRDKKTGECVKNKTAKKLSPVKTPPSSQPSVPKKEKRCPKGTHRNRKTGECEPNEKQKEFREAPLQLPEPIPVPRKVKSALDYWAKRQKQFVKYAGNNDISNLFYIYLLNKYRSNCLIYDTADNHINSYGLNSIGLTLRTPNKQERAPYHRHLHAVAQQIEDCIISNNSEVIIIPLWLNITGTRHTNVLIYRRASNTVEHFEPHGSAFLEHRKPQINKRIDDALHEFMTILAAHLPEVRLVKANEVCVDIPGLQILEGTVDGKARKMKPNEGGGYCTMWSMFFAELALKNPAIPSKELLDIIYAQVMESGDAQKYLLAVIQGYVYYMSEKLNKYYAILFGKAAIYDDLVSMKHTGDFYRKMFLLIRIEMRAINSPGFDLNAGRREVAERILTADNSIRKDLEDELFVYDRLIAANEEISPLRDLMDEDS